MRASWVGWATGAAGTAAGLTLGACLSHTSSQGAGSSECSSTRWSALWTDPDDLRSARSLKGAVGLEMENRFQSAGVSIYAPTRMHLSRATAQAVGPGQQPLSSLTFDVPCRGTITFKNISEPDRGVVTGSDGWVQAGDPLGTTLGAPPRGSWSVEFVALSPTEQAARSPAASASPVCIWELLQTPLWWRVQALAKAPTPQSACR